MNNDNIWFCRAHIPVGVASYRGKVHAIYENNTLIQIYYTYGYQHYFDYYEIDMQRSEFNTMEITGLIYQIYINEDIKVVVYHDATFTVNTILNQNNDK